MKTPFVKFEKYRYHSPLIFWEVRKKRATSSFTQNLVLMGYPKAVINVNAAFNYLNGNHLVNTHHFSICWYGNDKDSSKRLKYLLKRHSSHYEIFSFLLYFCTGIELHFGILCFIFETTMVISSSISPDLVLITSSMIISAIV